MKRFKRLARPFAIIGATVMVVAGLGFVERTADREPVNALHVEVDTEEGVHFINADNVRRQVLEQHGGVIGTAVSEVDVAGIETDLRDVPCVAAADAYLTLDGVLHVRVEQRRPLVRVINGNGRSFYIDEKGWTMPVSEAFTARVLVAVGDLDEPHTEGVHQVETPDSLAAVTRSDEIYRLARFIDADPLWSALIDQVVVNHSGGFELIPRVGMHRIILGEGGDIERQFEKLRVFYAKGIPQSGWRRIARIDLRFTDQVVCTNRNM